MRAHHVAFRTRDLARLTAFYTELMGLPVVRRTEGYSVWLRMGDGVLMLEQCEPQEPEIPEGSREMLAFAADREGLERVRTRFGQAGLPIEHETTHTLYLRDPDGRRVGVSDYPLL